MDIISRWGGRKGEANAHPCPLLPSPPKKYTPECIDQVFDGRYLRKTMKETTELTRAPSIIIISLIPRFSCCGGTRLINISYYFYTTAKFCSQTGGRRFIFMIEIPVQELLLKGGVAYCIAGNFCWCKSLCSCHPGIQKRFSKYCANALVKPLSPSAN